MAKTTNEVSSQQILSADILSNVNDIVQQENVPFWLNKDYLTKILRNYFGKSSSFKVERMVVKSLGGNGDSFASLMFRLIIDFSINKKDVKTMSVVLKTLPLLDVALEKLGSDHYNVQNKEMEMYNKIVPRMKELLEIAGESPNFAPQCYGIDLEHDVMVLEDLALSKFVMADRIKQLDLEHALLSLRLIARFHAASAFMVDENRKTFKLFNSGFFSRETDAFHVLFESICDALVDEVATWDGYEYYAKKLPSVRRNLIEYSRRCFDCDDDDFLVLNHGDLWTTNLMYNYDENGRPTDAKIIDFQFSWVGSPTIDLIYFLFTSTTDDLRQHRIEELVQFYYYELRGVLEKMSFDMKKFPSLHAFQLQFRKKYFYVVTAVLLTLPIQIGNDKDASFESLVNKDEKSMAYKRRIVKNPKFIEIAKKILPTLDRIGVLDEM